jgi:hypothetical protein
VNEIWGLFFSGLILGGVFGYFLGKDVVTKAVVYLLIKASKENMTAKDILSKIDEETLQSVKEELKA